MVIGNYDQYHLRDCLCRIESGINTAHTHFKNVFLISILMLYEEHLPSHDVFFHLFPDITKYINYAIYFSFGNYALLELLFKDLKF